MRTIIVEDEKPAVQKLQKALQQCPVKVEVVALLTSVQDAVNWLNQNQAPELIFMDIELSDGLSFKIFDVVQVHCPVIFTTAYDEYWQEAFEHNSIDYLLKPVRQDKLEAALNKYVKLRQYFAINYQGLKNWQVQTQSGEFKKRFLVKRAADYISVKTEDIAYFYATHKLVCLVDAKGQKFILDQSLSEIESQVDPAAFYRVNRKFLVNMSAVKRIKVYPKSKLLLEIEPPVSEEVIISQENVAAFKSWMGQ
jgi:two-component system LytT family response regulator